MGYYDYKKGCVSTLFSRLFEIVRSVIAILLTVISTMIWAPFSILGTTLDIIFTWQRKINTEKDSILITGCSKGIGYQVALAFNAIGFTVFATVRKERDGAKLKSHAISPDKMHIVVVDICKQKQVNAAVDYVQKVVGDDGLTALFNNAGVHHGAKGSQAIENFPISDWGWMFDVNVVGLVRMTQAFIPLLKQSKHTSARIVVNTSLGGIIAGPCCGPYEPSKHAAQCVANILRREMSYFDIKVSILEPGMIWSGMTFGQWEDDVARSDNSDAKWYPNEKAGVVDACNMMPNMLASPKGVSDVVIDAVLANNPRLHYWTGGMSTIAQWMSRRGERFQDKMMTWKKGEVLLDKNAKTNMEKHKDHDWWNPEDYRSYRRGSENDPLLTHEP